MKTSKPCFHKIYPKLTKRTNILLATNFIQSAFPNLYFLQDYENYADKLIPMPEYSKTLFSHKARLIHALRNLENLNFYKVYQLTQYYSKNKQIINITLGEPIYPKLIPHKPWIWKPQYNTTTVKQLAQTIYNNKSYTLMPILADALQDANCQDENMLEYMRQGNFFFRGFFPLDKAAGKR